MIAQMETQMTVMEARIEKKCQDKWKEKVLVVEANEDDDDKDNIEIDDE